MATLAATMDSTPTECSICVGTLTAKQTVQCPTCQFASCITCQKTYEKPACMSCRSVFSHAFVLKVMGKKYVKDVYKPHIHGQQIEAEKHILPAFQTIVDWEKEKREILALRRFNQHRPIPPKPIMPELNAGTTYACPSNACRGFVIGSECGVCKVPVCGRCREVKREDREAHVCNEDTVKNIVNILTESKPCPNCHTNIFRTMGCNHMHCTFCGVHFDFRTLRMLSNSSNRHYQGIAALRNGGDEGGDGGQGGAEAGEARRVGANAEDLCDLDEDDGIPQDVFESRVSDPLIIHILYEDKKQIKYTKDHLYDEYAIITKANAELHKSRMRYLLDEMTEKQWISRIIATYTSRDKGSAYSWMLHLLLITMKRTQRDLYNARVTVAEALDVLQNLFSMMNTNFAELKEEYGGSSMRLRHDVQCIGDPPLYL